MEVLNQNQRRSAKVRLLFLGLFVLGILATLMATTHKTYTSQGAGELEELIRKHNEERQVWIGKNQDLQNKNKSLKKEIKEIKAAKKDPNEQIIILEARIEKRKDRIADLEKDLQSCKLDLQRAASSPIN